MAGLALCAPVSACFAAQIDNLSGEPQVIEIAVAGGWQKQTLAAGEITRPTGKVEIRYAGREVHIEQDEEYAIWKDGTLGIQKHLMHSVGRLN